MEGKTMTDTLQHVDLPAEFRVRLDYYWQSLAVYALTLIVYIIVRALWEATLQQGIVKVVLTDPIVVLLGVFVLGSTVSLLFNSIARRTIIISDEGITFTSRFHVRTFGRSELESITLGRDRRIRAQGMFSVIRIRITGRRRALRVRAALYEGEHRLIAALLTLRAQLHAHHS